MHDPTLVREAVDRILLGELEPMLELLADDVAFEVAIGGDSRLRLEDSGKAAVTSYFTIVAPMATFWQMDYTIRGDQLIAWGRESFTVERCGLEAGSQFALVFDVNDCRIIRLLVIEDLPSFIRGGKSLPQPSTNLTPEPEPARRSFRPTSLTDAADALAADGLSVA